MQALKSVLRHSLFFIVPYAVFVICAETILALNSKDVIHLSINHHYSAFADFIMPYVTLAADGITVAVLVLLLIAWNRKYGFWTGIAVLLSSTITQILKNTVYSGEPRPKLFFTGNSSLHFVPGVENYLYDSFPSGHTTAAFAFYFCLVFVVKNNYLKTFLFLFALLIGYSRIYLSQHFLNDVFFGSLIGTLTTLAVMTYAVHKNWLYLPQSTK
ncbi:MAG: phosphatase PAP2 family protein [Bacteroidota bacterium]|nr:phosphatase PAP2 family protein [Bacteroidota bacterium]